ncbi:hypothetical protein GWI33_014041 [Rhynchophorus ferrugineus]|uniref:Odorant receptor n=1 Tax=Rhynchophorus ferrugineus TaxID=354439 RepID=A0A834I5W3_RHYFE|nr:hypothetical protein GWI33_014041 [Rhynchophorus ferrugineus]
MLHLCGYFIVVFAACHAGQILRDETYNIQDALYESNWIKADKEMVKDIQFIILRCQKPAILKAIPVGTFDYGVMIIVSSTILLRIEELVVPRSDSNKKGTVRMTKNIMPIYFRVTNFELEMFEYR